MDYPGHSFQHNESEWEPLTLYSVLLHLLHLCDGLPQVICELLAVLRVGGVEVNENFNVCAWKSWSETHSIGVIWKAVAGGEYLQTGGSCQHSDVPFSEGHANRYSHISQSCMTVMLILVIHPNLFSIKSKHFMTFNTCFLFSCAVKSLVFTWHPSTKVKACNQTVWIRLNIVQKRAIWGQKGFDPSLWVLTLVFKQKHLHPVKREGLPEAVRHRILLLLENLSDLNQKQSH